VTHAAADWVDIVELLDAPGVLSVAHGAGQANPDTRTLGDAVLAAAATRTPPTKV